MSKLVVENGERMAVQVPTHSPSSACVQLLDEDGRVLLSVIVSTFRGLADGEIETRAVVEGLPALLLQDASTVLTENGRVVFTRKQT